MSCASAAPRAPADDGVPAVIVDPTPESRAALQQAVTDALHGLDVLLAPDALTRESVLLLEPRHMEGRETRTGEKFRLVKSGAQCVLIHERTGQRFVLVQ